MSVCQTGGLRTAVDICHTNSLEKTEFSSNVSVARLPLKPRRGNLIGERLLRVCSLADLCGSLLSTLLRLRPSGG